MQRTLPPVSAPGRRRAALLPILLAATLLLAASPLLARSTVVRDETASFPREQAGRVTVDVPVGEVGIVASDGTAVEARLTLRCDRDTSRCRERAGDIRLEARRGGGDLDLRVKGLDRHRNGGSRHPEVELTLAIPRTLDVTIEIGVGELDATGLEGDVVVDLGVGEVRLSVPETAVHSVDAEVGVGEAHLSPHPEGSQRRSFLFLGNEVRWDEGEGRSRVRVEVGVGEASIRLTP